MDDIQQELSMTEITNSAKSSRESFTALVQNEMAAFEKREHEFRKQAKKNRAAELRLPVYIEN
jgi:hypothetical protein